MRKHTHTHCMHISLSYVFIYIYIIYTSCTLWSKQTISIFRCPLPTVAFKKYYVWMPMVSINNTTEKQPTIWSHRKSCYAKKLRELIAGWGLLGKILLQNCLLISSCMPCCGAPFASTKLARCRGMLLGAWIVKTGEVWSVFFDDEDGDDGDEDDGDDDDDDYGLVFFPAVFDWNKIQIHKYTHTFYV